MPPKKGAKATATPAKAANPDTVTTLRGKEIATTAAAARPRRESAVSAPATPVAKKVTKTTGMLPHATFRVAASITNAPQPNPSLPAKSAVVQLRLPLLLLMREMKKRLVSPRRSAVAQLKLRLPLLLPTLMPETKMKPSKHRRSVVAQLSLLLPMMLQMTKKKPSAPPRSVAARRRTLTSTHRRRSAQRKLPPQPLLLQLQLPRRTSPMVMSPHPRSAAVQRRPSLLPPSRTRNPNPSAELHRSAESPPRSTAMTMPLLSKLGEELADTADVASSKRKAPVQNPGKGKGKKAANVDVEQDDELDVDDDAAAGGKQYWLMKAEQEDRFETAKNGQQNNTKFTIDDLRDKQVPEPWDGMFHFAL